MTYTLHKLRYSFLFLNFISLLIKKQSSFGNVYLIRGMKFYSTAKMLISNGAVPRSTVNYFVKFFISGLKFFKLGGFMKYSYSI